MDKIINTIGMTIMLGKYMVLVLLAGLTVATGVNAADPTLMLVLDTRD